MERLMGGGGGNGVAGWICIKVLSEKQTNKKRKKKQKQTKQKPSLISRHLASVDVKQQVYLLIKQTTSQKVSHLVHVGALHAVPEDGLGVRPSTNHDLVRVMRAHIGGWQAHVRIVTRLNLLRRAHTWFQCYKCKINNGWDMIRSLRNVFDSRSVHYCEITWQTEMSNCVASNRPNDLR